MIIKDVVGIENFKNLEQGAIITCNHFNAFDSFAIQVAYDRSERPKEKVLPCYQRRQLYKLCQAYFWIFNAQLQYLAIKFQFCYDEEVC